MKYEKLHRISKRGALLASIQNVLEWDQETYMPLQGITIRSLQIEELASQVHKQRTSPVFKKALQQCIDLETGEVFIPVDERRKAALREWRRDYLKHSKLPAPFVKKFAQATTLGTHKWIKAKEEGNFKEFLPQLKKIIDLAKKKSDYLGYEEHPYDALLDIFEPGMKTSTLNPLFTRLKEGLTSLLKRIETKAEPRTDFLYGEFDTDKQMDLGNRLMNAIGLDHSLCRLDQSAHPFCVGIHMKDTRMTTRIHPTSLLSNIFSVVHEGGHALYNMGLPEEDFGSPLGEQISLGIDESQSRFWETRIGRSRSFWKYYLPQLTELFPEKLRGISIEDCYRAINLVKPTMIRVEADEVTYSLHVIIRFEIEKSLLDGSLKVDNIPEAWNAKMKEYLGICPKNDSEGCLQDIHWSMGGIGYFPTYSLGNLYAAQFFLPFAKDHPDWEKRVSTGELGFIREWLKNKIHRFGREFHPMELIQKMSGAPLSEKYFLEYLNNKYRDIYSL